jgi:hypothetical protein
MSKVVNFSNLKKEFDKSLIKASNSSGDVNSFKDLTKMKDKYLNMKREKGASKLGALEEKLNETGIGEKKKKFLQSSMKLGQKTLRGELTGNKLNISKSKGDAIEEYGESFKDKSTEIKGIKFKYSDITFILVIVYVIVCLALDGKKWFTIISPDNSLYIMIGVIVSIVSNNELGFPIKIMRSMMIYLMGNDSKYGFTYFVEKVWGPLFSGIRKGTSVSAKVFSWPLSKIILYVPLLIITFFQYAIPIIITIILIPITLIVGLITGIFTFGAGAEVTAAIAEVTDEGEAEADMFIAAILKKIWRAINKIIPFRKMVAVYIVGYTFYSYLLPMIISVYLTFAIFIVTHIILNTILIRGLLNNFPEKLKQYALLRILSYVLIMGAYYFIQFQVNVKFLMDDQDPITTILETFSLGDYNPIPSGTDIDKSVKGLMCPPDTIQNNADDILPRHFMICLYNLIAIMIIKSLYLIGDKYGKI